MTDQKKVTYAGQDIMTEEPGPGEAAIIRAWLYPPGAGDVFGFGTDDREAVVDLLRASRDTGHPLGQVFPDDEDDEDGPDPEGDGFVSLGTEPGGAVSWHVQLAGECHGSYPRYEFAVYQLARAMTLADRFPAAWAEGEHGPSSRPIDDEVRRHHDTELGEILLPLPGARFAPGDEVIDSDGGWPCTVIFDYGDPGVHVHAQGDPDVTAVVPPARLSREAETCGSCELPVVRQDTGIHEDLDYPAGSGEARYCNASPDHLHHPGS